MVCAGTYRSVHFSFGLCLQIRWSVSYGLKTRLKSNTRQVFNVARTTKVDARRIAIYAGRFQDKGSYRTCPTEDIERLKQLESERTLYVTDLAKYKGQMKDQKDYMPKALYERKMKRLQALMDDLEEAIQAITDEMDEVIASCPVLFRQKRTIDVHRRRRA